MSNLLRKEYQEVGMVEKLISPGDKVEMKSVEQVLLPDNTEGRKLYKSSVHDVLEDGKINILMPMDKTKLVLLPVDGEYEVCFFTSAGMYRGNVRIIERQKIGNNYVLVTELTTNLQKFQRREYYRLSCIIEMASRAITENEAVAIGKKLEHLVSENAMTKGVIVDISGGGLRFVSREKFEENQFIYIKFSIPIGGVEKEFDVVGKIVSSQDIPNRDSEYQNRVKFVYMDNITREVIIKYIFDEERKNRKNGKGF